MQENTSRTPGKMENEEEKRKPGTSRTEAPLRNDTERSWDDRFWLDPVDFLRNIPRIPNQIRRSMFPRIDVSETDTEVKVIADIPGVDPDDMYIDAKDNRMILKGKVERESESATGDRPYKYERMYGEFRREFTLPAPVNEKMLRALYKNGVLTITAPKTENIKKSKVKIERV